MLEILGTNLAPRLVTAFFSGARDKWREFARSHWEQIVIWAVFLLCLTFSAVGVGLSFIAFGPKITGVRMWGIGLVISIIMVGLSYGAKYANTDARKTFTPVDLIQYFSQGFLWPSTWPALADLLGVQKVISPPQTALWLLDSLDKVIGIAFVWPW